ncbi:MAG: hypothetical protein ACI9JN_001669, partial [Bacteroidia bacterium]
YYGQLFKTKTFTIGLHATPGSNVKMSRDEMVTTYNFLGNFFIDTLSNRKEAKFTQALPTEFGASFSFGNKDVWNIGVEYNTARWSDVTARPNDNPYYNQESFTVGGFWQAKAEMNSQHASKSEKTKDYLKTSRLYYGFRMQQLYTGVVDQQVQEMAFSFGIGLPMTRKYKLEGLNYVMVSRINIGLEYAIRGNKDVGMIQENIFGIKFGLTLTDKWFIKRKYQ